MLPSNNLANIAVSPSIHPSKPKVPHISLKIPGAIHVPYHIEFSNKKRPIPGSSFYYRGRNYINPYMDEGKKVIIDTYNFAATTTLQAKDDVVRFYHNNIEYKTPHDVVVYAKQQINNLKTRVLNSDASVETRKLLMQAKNFYLEHSNAIALTAFIGGFVLLAERAVIGIDNMSKRKAEEQYQTDIAAGLQTTKRPGGLLTAIPNGTNPYNPLVQLSRRLNGWNDATMKPEPWDLINAKFLFVSTTNIAGILCAGYARFGKISQRTQSHYLAAALALYAAPQILSATSSIFKAFAHSVNWMMQPSARAVEQQRRINQAFADQRNYNALRQQISSEIPKDIARNADLLAEYVSDYWSNVFSEGEDSYKILAYELKQSLADTFNVFDHSYNVVNSKIDYELIFNKEIDVNGTKVMIPQFSFSRRLLNESNLQNINDINNILMLANNLIEKSIDAQMNPKILAKYQAQNGFGINDDQEANSYGPWVCEDGFKFSSKAYEQAKQRQDYDDFNLNDEESERSDYSSSSESEKELLVKDGSNSPRLTENDFGFRRLNSNPNKGKEKEDTFDNSLNEATRSNKQKFENDATNKKTWVEGLDFNFPKNVNERS